MSCGCGEPNNDHDDARHITHDRLQEAANAAGISVEEAALNIAETLHD
jgi:hypothetical protein